MASREYVDEAGELAVAGAYDEAIRRLETLRQSPSIEVLALRRLAPVYATAGRLDDAIAAYRRYAEVTSSEEARLGLAKALARSGRSSDALAVLDGLDPSYSRVAIERARVLARLGRADEARRAIDRAFSDPEQRIERLRQRASLVLDRSPDAAGEKELRGLLAEAPEDPKLRSLLGMYLMQLARRERGEEALSLLRSAAAASPDDPDLLSNLGWGAYRMGNDAEAAKHLESAARLGGRRPVDLFRLSLPLRRSGDRHVALALLREAVAREPAASWASRARDAIAELDGESKGQAPTPSAGAS